VTPISSYTGSPEILGGRVKTLTPKVFGGILFDRQNASHRSDSEEHGIPPIDLVVVNLYPFEATVAREGVTIAEAIEQIDIGGPSMLRAAAKNHRDVLPLCSPDLYDDFVRELESGEISESFRRRAAIEVFRRTSAYDATIAEFLASKEVADDEQATRLSIGLERVQSLRYGETPQQTAAFYRFASGNLGWNDVGFRQLHGKELSYNNLIDLDAAWKIAASFDRTAATVIKHTNPAGTATAGSIGEAVRLAIEGDPVSAFGGIVAVNRDFDGPAAEAVGSLFLEVIVAPSFTDDAKEILQKKKNLRLIETSGLAQPFDIRAAAGGLLIQSVDAFNAPGEWTCPTKRTPSDQERRALEFAWIVCAHVKSNAIVIARDGQSVGIGAGQMSRVDSAKLAIQKAVLPIEGCVAASDAFFPFPDGLEVLAGAGIRAIVQPGGSVRDDEVIAAADRLGVAMLFTGERHFRH